MSTNNYGEPWIEQFSGDESWISTQPLDHDGDIVCVKPNEWPVSSVHWPDRRKRIVTCVNACADIPDPAASIPYLVTLAKIAQDLAKWSDRWPRKAMYSANNRKMDEELIELEERAKAAVAVFNA